MKILMPYIDVTGGKIDDPRVRGGTEAFSRLVYDNFDVVVVDIPWNTTPKENKAFVNQIRTIAHDEGCDLILSNSLKSPCMYGIRNIGKPIMHITHTNYGILTSNEILGSVEALGHSIFGVSQFNVDFMQRKAKRLGTPEINYSGIVEPSYAKHDMEVIESPESKVVAVGRANSYKAPFCIHKIFGQSVYSPTVITSIGDDKDSKEYYARNQHLPHLLGIPHTEVIDQLRTASASVITCPVETFGIAALESLSLGTPILIRANHTGKHASMEIAANANHYRVVGDDPIKAIEDLLKIDRKEIKEATHDKHTKERWKEKMQAAFESTVDKYRKHSTSTSALDEFFC